MLPGWLDAQSQQQRDDWDLALYLYQNQILRHAVLPKDTARVYPFLDALETDAKDRQQLTDYAQGAQAAHNDYYYSKFMDLVGEAQINGNDVLKKANAYIRILAEEPCEDYHCWATLGFKVKSNGPMIYKKALELKFDAEITRAHCQKLLNLAMGKMESQGPWIDGEVSPHADAELYGIDFHVRQACPPFPLPAEYERATEIMNRYLIDTLCKQPAGHQHYLDLAKQYKLPKAQEYIEGFYAVLKGKVEFENEGQRKPAPGAKVTVTDTLDKRSWETTADGEGKYRIKEAILHKYCSPFQVTAEFEGCTEDTSYEGPLEKPDKSKEHEFNIVIVVEKWQGSISGESELQSSPGSLTTQLGGDYRTRRRWTLRVTLAREPASEVQTESRRLIGMSFNYPKTMEFWKVKTAVLEYHDMLAGKLMDAKNQGVELKLDTNEIASGSRVLSAQECRLRLTVDKSRKTYKLNGNIDARQLPARGATEFLHRLGDVKTKSREPAETVDIKEKISVESGFTGDNPLELSGSKDEMAELEDLSPEGAEFLKSLEKAVSGGVMKSKVNWNLTKKK